jgi:hypothetical protein
MGKAVKDQVLRMSICFYQYLSHTYGYIDEEKKHRWLHIENKPIADIQMKCVGVNLVSHIKGRI